MWFWLDILASFPYSRVFEYIIEIDSKHALVQQSKMIRFFELFLMIRLLRFLRIIRTMRLLRLAKLKMIFEKIEEII
jgi:hyperpolarization activated cyclic nucleotide-gated potassium channel 2